MPAQIAAVVFALGILVLFLLDRDRNSRVFSALWLSTAWVPIAASRMVLEWLGVAPMMYSPEQYLEGSPLDRLILVVGTAFYLPAPRGQHVSLDPLQEDKPVNPEMRSIGCLKGVRSLS